jgi:tRNA uridine 5-carbamoylmethylation protein Kti12
MSSVIVTGLWGAGKTTYIRDHLSELLSQGNESLISVGPALLSGQIVVDEATKLYRTVCGEHVARLVSDRKSAQHALRTSSRIGTLMPRWVFDSLMFNVPVYGVGGAREDYLPLEQTLSENDTIVKYLRVPQDKLIQVCVEATISDRGEKWKAYLRRISLNFDGGLDEMLQARLSSLESWLYSSPLHVDVVEREWK